MAMQTGRQPLTPEEANEKRSLRALIESRRRKWEEQNGGQRLTQMRLGQIVGEMTIGEPISQGAVWQYLSESSKTKLNPRFVQAIAYLLDFDPAAVHPRFARFAGFQSSMAADSIANRSAFSSDNLAAGPETRGLVPVISWIQAGEWSEAAEPYPTGDYERMIPCLAKHGPQTYALRVEGDSMTSPVGRSYPEGSVIFVDPDRRNAIVGERVIAKINGNNMVTFKQLAADGNRYYLKPLNQNHRPIFDEFRIIGTVVGMWMDE